MTDNGDAIDQAIAASEERTVTMAEIPVALAITQRPVVLHVPVDMTDGEILELAAFVILNMRPYIQSRLPPGRERLWTPPV